MQFIPSGIEGLLEIRPKVYPDNRGWFYEFFREDVLTAEGLPHAFVQDNISFSRKGVVRGMHMQLPPHNQVKLVTVLSGSVMDVVVDLRTGSPTFGKSFQCVLDSTTHNMLLIPGGFVHGFASLEDSVFLYKMDKHYEPAAECGILWNDPDLKIKWPFENPVISTKDLQFPTLRELLRKSVISRS